MFTRKQYLKGEVTHDQYYSQFVTDYIMKRVKDAFGVSRLISEYKEDEYFNSIPLKNWDLLTSAIPASANRQLKDAGDYGTLAGHVCILKAAARMIVAENQ